MTQQKQPIPALTSIQQFALTPQAVAIFDRLHRTQSLSALEAIVDYGITSATLARRIVDLERVGVSIERERKAHPITNRRYTRYVLTGNNSDKFLKRDRS